MKSSTCWLAYEKTTIFPMRSSTPSTHLISVARTSFAILSSRFNTHTHTHTIKTRYTPEQVKKLLLRNLGAGGAAAPNAHHIVRRHIQHTNLYINVSSTEHTTLYTQYRTSAGDGADVKNLYYYHVPLP